MKQKVTYYTIDDDSFLYVTKEHRL